MWRYREIPSASQTEDRAARPKSCPASGNRRAQGRCERGKVQARNLNVQGAASKAISHRSRSKQQVLIGVLYRRPRMVLN